MEGSDYSKQLPKELWQLICNYLTRRNLRLLMQVDKYSQSIAAFELNQRPKFRLTDNTLNILVAGPPSSGKSTLVSTLVNESNSRAHNEHVVFTRSLKLTAALQSKSRVGRERQLTFFDVKGGRKKVLPVQLLTHATLSELLLLVVNAHECSTRAAQYEQTMKFLRAQLLSTMFAMSARDVVVAVNMYHDTELQGAEEFTEARQQLTRVISDTCDMYPAWYPPSDRQWHVVYVPVNIKRGFNLTPVNQKFAWHHGADLLTTLAENQLRNYYDEDVWNKLVKSPLYFPLIDALRVGGVGTVGAGYVMRGTVKYGDSVQIYPATRFPGDVLSVETNREHVSDQVLLPGDAAGICLRFTTLKELERRYGFLRGDRDTNNDRLPPVRQVFAFRVAVHELTPRRLVQHQSYHVFYGTARIICIVAWRFPASDHVILVPLTHYPVECHAASDTQKNVRGRVLVVVNGACVALGRVEHVMHGPNAFAAPTLQDYTTQYEQLCTQPDPLFSVNEGALQDQFVEHVLHSSIRATLCNNRK